MTDTVHMLEELVGEAVDRLNELSRERDELRREIDSLRERLDARMRQDDVDRSIDAESSETDRRAEALEVVRSALSELLGEETAA